MNFKDILSKFENPQACGNGYKVKCPAHNDKKASLFISHENNKTLINCHAGCETSDILEAVGLTFNNLFDEEISKSVNTSTVNKDGSIIYKYFNVEGELIFCKKRTKDKNFIQYREVDEGIIWGLSSGTYYEKRPKSWTRNVNDEQKKEYNSKYFQSTNIVLYNIMELVKAVKENRTVFIVEGEKDVENLRKIDIVATCNFDGASKENQRPKWKKAYNKYFKGANVVIIPDNDEPGKAHAKYISNNLKNIAKNVKLLELSGLKEKADISDWLDLGHTKEELIKLVKETTAIKNTSKKMVAAQKKKVFKKLLDISRKANIKDTKILIGVAKGIDDSIENKELESIISDVLKYQQPIYCNEKGIVVPYTLANYIISKIPTYSKGNYVYMYDSSIGVYKKKEIIDLQQIYFKYAIDDRDKKTNKAEEVAKIMRIEAYEQQNSFDEKRYINCRNGVIDSLNNKLMEHDPKYKSTVQFKANFCLEGYEKKFNNSTWKKFLDDVFPEKEDIKTLQEFFALVLSPHAREVEKGFFLLGNGSNGKSVCFDVCEALIGDKDLIARVKLNGFSKRFDLSMIEGKYVNIVRDDQTFDMKYAEDFNSTVSGEGVSIEKKGKDQINIESNLVFAYGLNRFPDSSVKTIGFFRRQAIIPFKVTFGSVEEVKKGTAHKVKNPNLSKQIIDNELDIVFMWAYKGLERLRKNEWSLTQSRGAIEATEDIRRDIDSSYAFYCDKLEVTNNKDDLITFKELKSKYEKYCFDMGDMPMSSRIFSQQLQQYGLKRGKKGSVRFFKGVTFKEHEEEEWQKGEKEKIF